MRQYLGDKNLADSSMFEAGLGTKIAVLTLINVNRDIALERLPKEREKILISTINQKITGQWGPEESIQEISM